MASPDNRLSGQRWGTFIRNHLPQIAAMDLFVVPTISFNLLYVLVIVRLARRELVWINVTAQPTAEWIAQQITEAFPWNDAPRHLIRDRDGIYGAAVRRRLRAMGIRDKPISAGSPWQNCCECLDHVVALGKHHLRLCRLLQPHENASVIEQRCADLTAGSVDRMHRIARPGGWTASPIRSNLGFRHTQGMGLVTGGRRIFV